MRRLVIVAVLLTVLIAAVLGARAGSASNAGGTSVGGNPHVVRAAPAKVARLSAVKPLPPRHSRQPQPDERAIQHKRGQGRTTSAPQTTTAVQTTTGTTTPAAATTSTFPGISYASGGAGVPPDMNGEVGGGQYVQMVNSSFEVFDKSTGAALYGPADIATLWQAGSGLCKTENDGDPVVLYDQVANRWVVSQFAFATDRRGNPVGPYYECVAISSSSDATGGWLIYSFETSTHLMDDYPKLGLWPDATNDMYVMTENTFDDNTNGGYAGAGVVLFQRSAMLAGTSATFLIFDSDSSPEMAGLFGLLPADFDGRALPPSGSASMLAAFDDDAWGYPTDQLELYQAAADWSSATGSITAMANSPLPVASFNSTLCSSGACIPQPGVSSSDYLDDLADRLMFRAEYRNLGGSEHLLLTHTVDAGSGRAGVRWYELRKDPGVGTSWSLYQQSTFAPADGLYRFMPSIAMDAIGDIAVGYSSSGSGSGQYPGLRYTTRLWSNALDTLQGETVMWNGGGSQTASYNRWGDYSDMTVDPANGCTFYYTNEYYPSTSSFNWQTRIGRFTLPQCTIGASSFSPAFGPAGTTVTIAGSGFVQGATSVSFNGTPASSISVSSPTSLTAVVPDGATTGPIAVTSPTGTVTTTATYSITAGPVPAVAGFTPASAVAGANVTITGTNLAGASAVSFGGAASPAIVSDTATQVVAQVPVDAVNGPITVTTDGGTSAPSTATFKPLAKITGFTGEPAQVGETVTVNGSNFTAGTSAPSVKLGTLALTPAAVGPTSFIVTLPDGALTARLTAANGNGTATSPTVLHVRPRIDGLSTGEGFAGTPVTLTGATFTGTVKVAVGGVAASFAVLDYRHLRVTIPTTAVTGPIAVTNAGGSTSSGTFTVDPKVGGFTPTAAAGLTNVAIVGSGLAGATTVTFNGDGASIVSDSATKLVAQVPVDATNGPIGVTTAAGTATSTAIFKPLPKITSFEGDPAQVGDTVTVHGYDFLSNAALPTVKLGMRTLTPSSVGPISFTVALPDGAVSARVTVANGNGAATSPTVLHVRPTIDALSATAAPTGTAVMLTGATFAGTGKVTVGGVAAGFGVIDYHHLRVVIPSAALTGPIAVTNGGGTTASATFTVIPRITGFTPTAAAAGTTVTLTGTGFGTASDTRAVTVGGTPAQSITYVSRTSVKFVLPASAASGAISITVNGVGGTSATRFTVR